MTPEQFVFWLRGYLASGDIGNFTRGDAKAIAEELAKVVLPELGPARLKSTPTLPVHTPTRLPHAPWFHFSRVD
jgi:hypothetical protein